MKNLVYNFLDFIFPMFCLHCEEKTQGRRFCSTCAEYLTLSSDRSILLEANLISNLYIRYVQRYQFPSDVKTLAAYIILKLDQLGGAIPDRIFGKNQLTRAIAKQIPFFYKNKNLKTGKKVLEIQERRIDNQPSIFLLMT